MSERDRACERVLGDFRAAVTSIETAVDGTTGRTGEPRVMRLTPDIGTLSVCVRPLVPSRFLFRQTGVEVLADITIVDHLPGNSVLVRYHSEPVAPPYKVLVQHDAPGREGLKILEPNEAPLTLRGLRQIAYDLRQGI